METGIKSSFIPQAPIAAGRSERRSRGVDLLFLFALVVFVASATLAVGVFLYDQYLTTSANSKRDQLERAKNAFEPSLIQELTRLDDRMRAADDILSKHTAPSSIFKLLEQLTLQTVAFSSFEYVQTPDVSTITMQGVAQSVNSIAYQADLLSKSGVVVNPIFSNINRQLNGVRFDFSADVPFDALRYKSLVIVPDVEAPLPTSPFGTPIE